jgi:hypothetical protein
MQFVEPFVSSEDIAKGTRWGNEITRQLESCQFGIICLPNANVGSEWVHFEAGAIAQKFTEGPARGRSASEGAELPARVYGRRIGSPKNQKGST